MKTSTFKKLGALLSVVLAALMTTPVSAKEYLPGAGHWHGRFVRFAVDIAEDPTRFSFDTTGPNRDDGTPDYGNPFVTQGYIYPKGTLQPGDSGVDADGKPLYPDLVLGEWTCRGVFVGEGFATVTGPIVNTTQLFSFYSSLGFDSSKLASAVSLVSEGFELADVDVPVARAITRWHRSF